MKALGKVQFSAKIDFSYEHGLTIEEINNINSIEPNRLDEECVDRDLQLLMVKMRTKKQKQLLELDFSNLKQIYMTQGESAFNKEFKSMHGLGRSTKTLLLSSFK
jgi:hypothetical protein